MAEDVVLAVPKSVAQRETRECPFAGVAVPVRDQFGQPMIAMQRAACGPSCALYDRHRDLPCLLWAVRDLKEALGASNANGAEAASRARV